MPRFDQSPSTAPATIRERFEWLLRLSIPLVIGGYVQLRILRSLSNNDLSPWQPFEWSKIIRGDFDSLDIDLLAHNMLSLNVLTKGVASMLVLVGSLYFADYATTGRRRGWQVLASPIGKSVRRRLRFWLLLWGLYVAAIATTFAVIISGAATLIAAFRLLMIGHALITIALVVANDGFEGFLQLLPELRIRREQRRRNRDRRRRERRERLRREEEEARRREEALRERQEEIARLRMSCNQIEQEIGELTNSDEPEDVVSQQIGELNAEHADLIQQIQQLQSPGGVS